MTVGERYERKIARYDWNSLLDLWGQIQDGKARGWQPGKAFEYLVLRAFQLDGAEVRWPYRVSLNDIEIEQIDGVLYFDGLACLVECKDQVSPTNIEPIAKMRSQLLRRPGTVLGAIFSSKGFTDPAATLARFTAPQTILLWDGEELEFAIRKQKVCQAFKMKYRACVEQGLPDYNIIVEEFL